MAHARVGEPVGSTDRSQHTSTSMQDFKFTVHEIPTD